MLSLLIKREIVKRNIEYLNTLTLKGKKKINQTFRIL